MFRLTSPDDQSERLFHDPGSVVETLTQVLVVCLLPFRHSQAVTPHASTRLLVLVFETMHAVGSSYGSTLGQGLGGPETAVHLRPIKVCAQTLPSELQMLVFLCRWR